MCLCLMWNILKGHQTELRCMNYPSVFNKLDQGLIEVFDTWLKLRKKMRDVVRSRVWVRYTQC